MAIDFPDDPIALENRSLTDLARELPESANPFLPESWMGAQGKANARRVFEFYNQLRILEQEAIPVTAQENLELWASLWGITRLPATKSSGFVVATGVIGSVIPQSSQLQSSDGNSYSVAVASTITQKVVSVTSLTSVGTTATAVLASDQQLFSGLEITIAGANEPEYNGTFEIDVTDTDTFEFEIPSAAASPATGTITATFVTAAVQVQSVGFGQSQNLSANAPVTLASPIVGVDTTAYVTFGAVGGGSDEETNEELRSRMLDRIQNPVALFNAAAITAQAKTVAGVTDVFVEEITPAVGQVTIYFVRGNDANPIPEASEVTTVKNAILQIKPAHTADADVIVLAPTAVPVTFSFSALSPNNASMRDAITANLEALFVDGNVVGEAITQDDYRCAILNTIDPQTGNGVDSFTLSSPVGDVGGGAGEYPVISAVNFP